MATSESIQVLWRDLTRPKNGAEYYEDGNAFRKHIKAGWRKEPGLAAFQTDTVWDKDVAIAMRDGVEIRVDVFRPADTEQVKVPALIAWSPYGKSGRGQCFRYSILGDRK